jgi:DNA/RNA-binding protein KIN17
MEMEQSKKKARTSSRKDHWVARDIVVKVMNKAVGGGKYHKEKGVIVKVHDLYVAEVEMLASGDVLKLDQQDLETVIPKLGGKVLVVNGPHDGCTGRLERINTDKFCASVTLDSGADAGRMVELPYEDFSKYSPA